MKQARTKGFESVRRLRTRAERGGEKGGTFPHVPESPRCGDLGEAKGAYLRWMEGRKLSPLTVHHRNADLEQFFGWAGDHGIGSAGEITLAVLESYQRWLGRYRKKDGRLLSPRTLRSRLSTLQDYFRWLVRHGLIGANPASELVLPRKVRRLPEQGLSLGQIDALMSVPDLTDPLGLRDRALLETLYGTALRLGELARLSLDDLHLEKRTLHVREGKGGKDRIVPLGERTRHWLVRYLEETRPRLELDPGVRTVFLTGYGEGFHSVALGTVIRKYLRAADVAKGGAHLLRHTCSIHLLEGGADIRYIQKLLGHASLETTAIYTEMSVESLRQVFSACHPAEKRWRERGA